MLNQSDSIQIARDGQYFLKRDRNKAGTIGIYTVKAITSGSGRTANQTVRVASTDTSDPQIAEIALKRFILTDKEALHALRTAQKTGEVKAQELPVLEAVTLYYLGRAEKKSKSLKRGVRALMAALTSAFPENPLCSSLDRDMQKRFVDHCREKLGHKDSTIHTHFNYLFTAMHWCNAGKLLAPSYPRRIPTSEWEANLQSSSKGKKYSLAELAMLFAAARKDPYHWRYMVCAVATASRPIAILELRYPQLDLENRICHLNAEGRRQTKKRRPTVPMCPTFFNEVQTWERPEGRDGLVVGMRSTGFFTDSLAPVSGVERCRAMRIRHTVRTWLAKQRVPDAEGDVFVGHAEEGSATGRRFYKDHDPDYLSACSAAVEKLFEEIARINGIPFAGMKAVTLEDQPLPDVGRIVALRSNYVAATSGNILTINGSAQASR